MRTTAEIAREAEFLVSLGPFEGTAAERVSVVLTECSDRLPRLEKEVMALVAALKHLAGAVSRVVAEVEARHL